MILNQLKTDGMIMKYLQNPIKVEPKDKKSFKRRKEKSFHKSIAFVLLLAQCFGQLPVQGILCNDVQSLRFSWKSWRTVYSILICVGAAFISLMQIASLLTKGMNLFEISK